MLVNRHVHLPGFQTVTVSNPCQCLFQQFLPNRVAFQVSVSHFRSNTVAFREVVLRIGQPRSRVCSIQQFLRRQNLASDVNALEPFQFLGFGAFADVDRQLIVQNCLLFLVGQVLEELVVAIDFDRKILVDVLGNRDGTLLPIKNLVCVSPGLRPVHNVQRKSVHYGIDDGCTLLLPVNELALERRANRKTVIVAKDTAIAIVLVVLYKVGYLNSSFSDFHYFFSSSAN